MNQQEINRRVFLRKSMLTVGAVSMAGCATSKKITDAEQIANAKWTKHGIVLEATEPWEGTSIQSFTSSVEPQSGDRVKIWYSLNNANGNLGLACADGIPGVHMRKVPAVVSSGEPKDSDYSIGNLPTDWRPVQATHIRLNDGRHRLYFWVHGPRVVRYLVAESNDGRRYRVRDPLKAVLYHPSDRAAWGVTSPDGMIAHRQRSSELQAGEKLAESRQISNDATTIYQMPDGTFEMYSVALIRVPKDSPAYVAEDNAPGLIRVVDRYASEDGLHFEQRQRAVQPDSQDPADQQFYYLSVTHTGRERVGILGNYRCRAQTMDLELCFSDDGVQWRRPNRQPWIARSEPPAPDCFGMYAPNRLIKQNGRWHLLYTGVNHSHNLKKSYGPARQLVMWASCPA
jgi:hypothetical protein